MRHLRRVRPAADTTPGRLLAALALLGLLAFAAPPVRADEPAPAGGAAGGDAEEPAGEDLALGVLRGDRVNLRVGPRIDNRPVKQLDEGTVVLVVERVPGWLGVRVPAGFPVAVATDYLEVVGPDALRVEASDLNLRVEPPEEGRPMPAAFRDHPARGAILPLIGLHDAPHDDVTQGLVPGGWAWVLAPESIRAYVSDRFVEVLGPCSEHPGMLEAARARRAEVVEQLARSRREAAARRAAQRLAAVLGRIQTRLHELRREGGHDKAPIVALAGELDAALDEHGVAHARVLTLARALREDLEREIVLRVARHDAAVARARRQPAPAVPPLEEAVDDVTVVGAIRYEPTPGWREEGIHILWVDGEPAFVLRLTTGGELPHPDFAAHAGRGPRRIEGARPGERLFGLPVLDVRRIREPAD